MTFRVVVTGAGGQLGRALAALPPPPGVTLLPLGRDALDLADPAATRRVMTDLAPQAVVNCAAYTAVDRAEAEPALAWAVNADAAGLLASLCAERDVPILQVSTDYVFDGAKAGGWLPDDPVGPLNAYGASKEAGERAVRTANPRHMILRSSWLYAAHGHNFVRTMVRLGANCDIVRVVADQRGCPTAAGDLAGALSQLLARLAAGRDLPWGTWHFANAGATTWHGLAEAVFDLMAPTWGRCPVVEAIATADYPSAARRPANSVLECEGSLKALGLTARPWRQALARVVGDILSAEAVENGA